MEQKGQRLVFQWIITVILCFSFILCGKQAEAALFGFSIPEEDLETGELFSISVHLTSSGRAVNAVSGVVTIPSSLEVISISSHGSIIGFWVKAPTYSAGERTIAFEGVIFNPGYEGSAGHLFQVHLRGSREGAGVVRMQSGAILAHDGQGTNVLERTSNIPVIIGTPTEEVNDPEEELPNEQNPEEPEGTQSDPEGQEGEEEEDLPTAPPAAPQLNSVTHPIEGAWYNHARPIVTWSLPRHITGARVGVSRTAKGAPTEVQQGAVSTYQTRELEDGVWYLHVQIRNQIGWSPVSHYKVQIDTQAPTQISLKEIPRDDLSNPDVQFQLSAEDSLSGVNRFAVRLDNTEEYVWIDDSSNLALADMYPGMHGLSISAIDNAGNATSTSVVFYVEPLEAPVLEQVPTQVQSNEAFLVAGKTRYASTQVVLWLEKSGQQALRFFTKSDKNGEFTFAIRESLPAGNYRVSAEVVDDRGARSHRSNAASLLVYRPIAEYAPYLVGILLLVLCIVLGIFLRQRFGGTVNTDIQTDEEELLKLAHQMRQKLRKVELRERARRRAADRMMFETKEEIVKEFAGTKRARKSRKQSPPGEAR